MIVSLAVSAVLLIAFAIIELRGENRCCPSGCCKTGTGRAHTWYHVLCVGTAIFGMFFFLTICSCKRVWGTAR